MSLPMITCVMVTGKTPFHAQLAARAIQCFRDQTYPADRRELCIVNDGSTSLVSLITPEDTNIREIGVIQFVPGEKRHSLGELRNTGLEFGEGDWFMQWDDDDWHHPERMHRQWAAAEAAGGTHCVLLTDQLRYCVPTNCARQHTEPVGIAGTILHPRTTERYPALAKGEDSEFWLKTWGEKGRILLDNRQMPELYVRFWWGDTTNTWGEQKLMRELTGLKNTWTLPLRPGCTLCDVLKSYGELLPGKL